MTTSGIFSFIVFFSACIPLLSAWLFDKLWGDPKGFPHLVVGFGKMISWAEHILNKGKYRIVKGAFMSLSFVLGTFWFTYVIVELAASVKIISVLIQTLLIFYCLAGTTLITEVKKVFDALNLSLEQGRMQVSRIVGRDTTQLSDQEVRKAALETLAENLSDGVIAPLFWFLFLGVPGMVAYKMVNTLDSMIGYHTERFLKFGAFAARLDDIVNYIPARLTAFLMVIASLKPQTWKFVVKYGKCHASPNSGYPESALAGILDCRFGGPHYYFGELFDKPFIGENDRILNYQDMIVAVGINKRVEFIMIVIAFISKTWFF